MCSFHNEEIDAAQLGDFDVYLSFYTCIMLIYAIILLLIDLIAIDDADEDEFVVEEGTNDSFTNAALYVTDGTERKRHASVKMKRNRKRGVHYMSTEEQKAFRKAQFAKEFPGTKGQNMVDRFHALTQEEKRAIASKNTEVARVLHAQADMIAYNLAVDCKLSQLKLRGILDIGGGRATKLMNSEGRMRKSGNPDVSKLALTELDMDFFHTFMRSHLPTEEGYPACHGRHYKFRIVLDPKVGKPTWKKVYKMYLAKLYERNMTMAGLKGVRALKCSTFYKKRKQFYPNFALNKKEEDICDACSKLKAALESKVLSREERLLVKTTLDEHVRISKIQRKSMNSSIEKFGNHFGLSKPRIDAILSFLPGNYASQDCPESSVVEGDEVLMEFQDYGGSAVIPSLERERIAKDYYTSNVNVYIFVVANATLAKNYAYIYDERVMGKGAAELLSLR